MSLHDPTASTTDADDPVRAEAVRALETEFGELITRMRRILTETAQRVSPGMLPAAYKVFTTIVRHENISQSALAEHLLLDKGQLSRTVRELEKLGLIARHPDPSDGRASILSATPLGLERLAEARTAHADSLVRALDAWPVADIRNLTLLLSALRSGAHPETQGASTAVEC